MSDLCYPDIESQVYAAIIRSPHAPRTSNTSQGKTQGGSQVDYKLALKSAKFLVEVGKLYKGRSGDVASVMGQTTKTTGAATSVGGLQKTSFVLSQLGTSMATSAKILSMGLSPAKATVAAASMIGQKAAITAGLVSNSELAMCRTALVGLAASGAAAAVLGPVGVLGWLSLSITAADVALQCRNVGSSEILGIGD